MRLLLDTHAAYWAIREPTRIPTPARDLVEDMGNEVLVSAITPWELGIKFRKGLLPGAGPFLEALERHLRFLRATELPVTLEHSLATAHLEWTHRDPFDRMLAAQAIVENAVLVTADAAFSSLAGLRTAWK